MKRRRHVFFAVDLPQGGRISRTKILNFLETHNEVAVCTPDPEQAFFPLPAGIRCCRGCGRRGSERSRRIFDDSPQRALGFAQRTCGAGRKYGGMCRARSRRGNGSCGCGGGSLPLPDVACLLYARAVGAQGYALVRMRVSSSRALKPQREEGIDVAAWCPAAELKDRLEGMFPTVRRVFECLEK